MITVLVAHLMATFLCFLSLFVDMPPLLPVASATMVLVTSFILVTRRNQWGK